MSIILSKSASSAKKPFTRYAFEVVLLCLVIGAVFVFQQRNMLPSDGSVSLPDTQFVTLSGQTPKAIYVFESGQTNRDECEAHHPHQNDK